MQHRNGIMRRLSGGRLAVMLAALIAVPILQAQPLTAAPSPATAAAPASNSSDIDWPLLLDGSGVAAILAQTNDLIGQEMANLEKAPLGFTPQELSALQQQFRARLGSDPLRQEVITRLQQQLNPEQARQLQHLLQSPRMKFLHTLQAQLNDDAVRQSLRTYRVQVRETVPNSDRLQLLTTLDDTRGLTALETALKVEMRKQMLVTVTQVKLQESVPESLLDTQLQQYRQDVAQQLSRKALDANLYLLKRTPSAQVQDLISTIDQPAFDSFMTICQGAILDSFRAARAQLQRDLRLARQ